MFTFMGALLAGYGVFKPATAISLDTNIKPIRGLVLLVIGGLMLLGAIRRLK